MLILHRRNTRSYLKGCEILLLRPLLLFQFSSIIIFKLVKQQIGVTMSTPSPSQVRQRVGKGGKRSTTPQPEDVSNGSANTLAKVKQQSKAAATNNWEYKVALLGVTVLAFATRFWGIAYPTEVVFDEVHFGKVCDDRQIVLLPDLS